jgi:hypothetical protein
MLAAGLADENLLMLANFDGVYLVHLDVDEWGWRNVAPGFSVSAIPTFFRLDASGRPTGDTIDAGAWNEDTYEDITRVLGPWFHNSR